MSTILTNSPASNRFRVALGQVKPRPKLGEVNKGKSGHWMAMWPCKEDHPFYRIYFDKKNRKLRCRECDAIAKKISRGTYGDT